MVTLFCLEALADYTAKPTVIEGESLDPFSKQTGIFPAQNYDSKKLKSDALSPSDSLKQIPGLQIRGDLEGGSPFIGLRGSSSAARFQSLFDGISLNLSDGTGPQDFLIPWEAIKGATLIRGPLSIFYGSDGMTGSLNFLPKIFEEPRIKISGGSFGQKSVFAGIPLFKGHQLTGYYDDRTGAYPYKVSRTNQSGTRNSNDRALQRYTFAGVQKSSKWSISENFIFSKKTGSTPGSIDFLSAENFSAQGLLGTVSGQYNLSDADNFSARLSFIKSQYKSIGISSGAEFLSEASRVDNLVFWNHFFGEATSANFFLNSKQDTYHSSAYGAQSLVTTEFEPGVSITFPFADGWTLQPAVRYLPKFERVVPALSLEKPTPDLKLWGFIGQGFRAPSLSQRFGETSFIGANPNLKPEISLAAETGFLKSYSENIQAGATAFSIKYSDLMILTQRSDGKNTFANSTSASAYGVDITASYRYDDFSARADYTYMKAQDYNNIDLILSPEHQIKLVLDWNIDFVTAELVSNYWSRYFDRNFSTLQLQSLDPFYTLDFHLISTEKFEWQFQLSVINILDTPQEFTIGYPEPQRRFYASARKAF